LVCGIGPSSLDTIKEFKDSYLVLEKNPGLCFMKENKIH
jgi:hypothetical protein